MVGWLVVSICVVLGRAAHVSGSDGNARNCCTAGGFRAIWGGRDAIVGDAPKKKITYRMHS